MRDASMTADLCVAKRFTLIEGAWTCRALCFTIGPGNWTCPVSIRLSPTWPPAAQKTSHRSINVRQMRGTRRDLQFKTLSVRLWFFITDTLMSASAVRLN